MICNSCSRSSAWTGSLDAETLLTWLVDRWRAEQQTKTPKLFTGWHFATKMRTFWLDQGILRWPLTYCSFWATHHEQNLQRYSDELLFRVRALDQLESQWFLMVTTRRQHYHKISWNLLNRLFNIPLLDSQIQELVQFAGLKYFLIEPISNP